MNITFASRTIVPLAGLTLLLSACGEDITRPTRDDTGGRKAVSGASSTLVGNGVFRFDPLSSSATCRDPDHPEYRPFNLPVGFRQTIIATEWGDFRPVAGPAGNLPDMLTLNETGPERERYLYRTHEVGANAAVTVTDRVTGTTSLVVQESHYERLDGIRWTPWGTLLFAEEVFNQNQPDPDFPAALRGLTYEYDPGTGVATVRPALGARNHEGMTVDADGNVYGLSESRGRTQYGNPGHSGALFKFVPDAYGDLSSGQLYALKVRDGVTKTGTADWLPLDPDDAAIDSDAEAVRVGATGWERPEDWDFLPGAPGDDGVAFVSITDDHLVLRVELMADSAFVTKYVNGPAISGFNNPDNIALDPYGNVYICEDRSRGDIWVAFPGAFPFTAGSVERFASLADCDAEPTGIYLNGAGSVMWVQVQHAGGSTSNDLTVEIRPVRDVASNSRHRDSFIDD